VGAVLRDATPEAVVREVKAVLGRGKPQLFAFDAWVPDADATNPLAGAAAQLDAAVKQRLTGPQLAPDARAAFGENGLYAQACVMEGGVVAVGVAPAREAPSLAPGGRLRVHVSEEAPSRAAMKLEEALLWLDRSPEPGDLCVDLGASPGGWTWVLLERRARVLAVDPGDLAPNLRGKKGLVHLRADAFKIEPEEPMDWLFCDMAFRPLEVAGLLSKWARRKWARLLVANIKLPMRQKAQHLYRVRDILEDGGWQSIRVRQLYHDRDEVTFAGVRLK
jgi:23S rRNA (cytidine2498-2'-O)-methyltransferase